jgi:hypothetical protein
LTPAAPQHERPRQPGASRGDLIPAMMPEIDDRALDVNPLESPSRLIKNEDAFKSADELKLNRTETIAFNSE